MLAALGGELRTLNDLQIDTDAPIEGDVLDQRRGSRFVPVMMGSGSALAGVFPRWKRHGPSRIKRVSASARRWRRSGYIGEQTPGGPSHRRLF
ncbi:hypothetical protein LNQ03_08510 [Klebsiella pneumoniae subsp. pneumoniae]|nr:hypothetical protein [Klebsiella pneumoniae subsp. pneumoniae]